MGRITAVQTCGVRKHAVGAAHLASSSLILNVLSVPALAYIIRRLGAAAYGEWATAAALCALFGVLTSLGLRGTFVRRVARNPESAPESTAQQLGSRLVLSIGAACAAILLSLSLGYSTIVVQCVAVGGGAMIVGSAGTTLSDLAQGLQKLKLMAATNLLAGLALTATSIVVAWRSTSPVALSLAYLVGPIVSVVVLMRVLTRDGSRLKVILSLKGLFLSVRESRFFCGQAIVAVAGANAAALLLPRLVGVTAFGFYAAGSLIATRLQVIPDALGTALYPAIAAARVREPAAVARLVLRGLGLGLLVCAVIALMGTLLAGPIAHVLFPRDGAACQSVIRVTVWALPLSALVYIMGYSLNAAGRDAVQLKLSLVSTSLGLLSTLAMVLCWGVAGACWSLVVRSTIDCVFLAPAVRATFFTGTEAEVAAEVHGAGGRPVVESILEAS